MLLALAPFVILALGLWLGDLAWIGRRWINFSVAEIGGEPVRGVEVCSREGYRDGPMVNWYLSTGTVALAGWVTEDSVRLTLWDPTGKEIGKVSSSVGCYWGEGVGFCSAGDDWRLVAKEELEEFGRSTRPDWEPPWIDSATPAADWRPGFLDWALIRRIWGRFPFLTHAFLRGEG